MGGDGPPLLAIEDLHTYFRAPDGPLKAVEGVSLSLRRGETLGLVGESGSGKSVTALSILRLVPTPPGIYASGTIRFEGTDLLTLSESELERIRGKRISMIFQEPMTSLNPVFRVGAQIAESLIIHEGLSRKEARKRGIGLLERVGIPSPEQRFDEYPHQLSGGMKQRVMIAIALACKPDLLIADEPTTALDVTVQAQILDRLRDLQAEFGMTVLLITHDLGVVAELADRVAVMYAGRIAEKGSCREVFEHPSHPYTEGLFRSLPRLGRRLGRLETIPGRVPGPDERPTGCGFRNRCDYAFETCETRPELEAVSPGHEAACWLHTEKPDHRISRLGRKEVASSRSGRLREVPGAEGDEEKEKGT